MKTYFFIIAATFVSQLAFGQANLALYVDGPIERQGRTANAAVILAETRDARVYVGRKSDAQPCYLKILEINPKVLIAQPYDAVPGQETETYEALVTIPARQLRPDGKAGPLLPGVFQGQISTMIKDGYGSALQITLDRNNEPLSFAYASNIYPSIYKKTGKIVSVGYKGAPSPVEIECDGLELVK